MDTVEQLGSFLGLASFFALALVALLLFQLARDVRRLRDWAGRAPERAAVAAERASQDYAEQASDLKRVRAEAAGDTFWHARNIAVAGIGALIFAIGAIVGISNLTGDDDGGGSGSGAERSSTETGGGSGRIVPGSIRVAVLNGTEVPGLAASVGDTVEENGFQLGAVTNSDRSFDLSLVMYRRGRKREADAVASAIGFGRVRLMTGDIQGISGGANVVAVVGRDRATG